MSAVIIDPTKPDPEPFVSPTTLGSVIGAAGTILTGIGFLGMFFPPLVAFGPIGAAVSAFAKYYTGLHTADAK